MSARTLTADRAAPPPRGSDRGATDEDRPGRIVAPTIPRWSARLLELGRRSGAIPVYGSGDWHALDRHDPRRFAAVVAAAECWRQDGEDDAIAERLAAELADADLYVRYRLSEASRDVASGYEYRAVVPVAELQRRRDELIGVAS